MDRRVDSMVCRISTGIGKAGDAPARCSRVVVSPRRYVLKMRSPRRVSILWTGPPVSSYSGHVRFAPQPRAAGSDPAIRHCPSRYYGLACFATNPRRSPTRHRQIVGAQPNVRRKCTLLRRGAPTPTPYYGLSRQAQPPGVYWLSRRARRQASVSIDAPARVHSMDRGHDGRWAKKSPLKAGFKKADSHHFGC